MQDLIRSIRQGVWKFFFLLLVRYSRRESRIRGGKNAQGGDAKSRAGMALGELFFPYFTSQSPKCDTQKALRNKSAYIIPLNEIKGFIEIPANEKNRSPSEPLDKKSRYPVVRP